MNLKVFTPSGIAVNEEIQKIVFEGMDGSRCLLPHHRDFVTLLISSIISYFTFEERFLAIDQGVLVKKGEEVFISTYQAIPGEELGKLENVLEERYKAFREHEKRSKTAMAKLEREMMKNLLGSQRL